MYSPNLKIKVLSRRGPRNEAYYHDKRESRENFIKSLKGVESHYVKGKSEKVGLYLQSELSIAKLAKM